MRLPLILSFLWLVFKAIALQLSFDSERVGIILNVFFLVLIIFLAIRAIGRDLRVFELLKSGMRPAMLYILLVSVGIFIYYKWLDPGAMPAAMENAMVGIEQSIEEQGGFEVLEQEGKALGASSRQEYLDKQRETLGNMFSPFSRATQSMLGLTLLGFLYCLMVVGLFKIARRFIK